MSRSVASLATRSFSRGISRSAARVVCALVLFSALCACKSDAPVRRLTGITPTAMRSDAPQEITIQGEGFLDVPRVALMSSSGAQLRQTYQVQLIPGDFTVEVTTTNPSELKFEPPLGLAHGVYDVRVVPPLGAALLLPQALTIEGVPAKGDAGVDASVPRPDERRLSLETRADGEGEVISAPSLSVGDTLDVFAIFREPDGSVSNQSETVVFTLGRKLAELYDVEATRSSVRALLPGKVSLLARAGSSSSELEITIVSDSQNALADLHLSLEDKPGGAGTAYTSSRQYVAGKLLDVYAVVRDPNDGFVVDVPVTWILRGIETQDGSQTTSYGLLLLAAGTTTLRASHEELASVDLTVIVSAGPAFRLTIEPESASLRAGDPALTFAVSAVDEYGNATTNTGNIEYNLVDGTFSGFDALSATLMPERIGTGRVTATSSYGPEVTSGTIEVTAGPLARLSIAPETLQLTADDAPVQFEATGFDEFDNPADMGDLTWSVASGPVATIGADGELDPTTAGTGTVRASSSFGVSALSGSVTIAGGRAVTLSILPDTWQGIIGAATRSFMVNGVDGDANPTTDLGTVSFGVTGPIRAIDTQTGLFTPTIAGQGTVTASSSYGPSVATRNILVSNPNATLAILDFRASNTLYHGGTTRMEVDVRSTDVADVVLTGLGFTATNSGSVDISNQYSLLPDNGNIDRIPPGVTQTLVYYLSVAGNAAYEGTVNLTARGEAFISAGTAVMPSRTVSSIVSYPAFGTALTIDAPVPPADRACTGGRITFGATASSPFTYTWRLPEGTFAPGSSLSDRYPQVDYSTTGPKAVSVTASYTWLFATFPTTLVGKPVFVGTSTSVLMDTYPTGRIVFSGPSADQNVPLSSFPRSDLIALDAGVPVRQCNNVAIAAGGHNELTVFSDRRLIDPAADVDPSAPGIQVELTAQGGLPSIPLIAPTSISDGATTVYAEYFEPNSGKVTSAGDQTFNLTGDTQAPSVRWTSPASDCAGACLKTRDPLVFQFSEPMWVANLGNLSVDLYSGSSTCTSSFSDWTGSSSLRYDSAESALYVVTPSRAGSYSVRVRLPASVTDAATARNALPAFSRCVVFSTLADPAAPTTPQLIATPATVFSPDGDQNTESVTWNVNADAATTLLRLRVSRAGRAVFGSLLPVTQAGPYSLTWDGADANGRIVNNGAYSYAIEALNRAGTASTALKGYVDVNSALRFVTLRRRQ